jgi:DNA-binding GntR family transcriptional regulator
MRREPDDLRPDYVLIADELRTMITTGKISVGDQLPTQKAVAEDFGVPPATAQKAFNVLKAEGFAAGATGRGTYVISAQPSLSQADDTARQLAQVHQRLDALEVMVRELRQAIAAQASAAPKRSRATRA